ncbi:MAG TPA: ice-binding family protein [Burkholderiales bacterium]|nr:ice-binding family protein [Burkholderiales bacterium]
MHDLRKHLYTSLLTAAALLGGTATASAQQVTLGTASAFSVLGSPVTTSGSTITGDVGSAGAVSLTSSAITGNLVYTGVLTNTASTISGTSTQPLPAQVVADFNSAYTAALAAPCPSGGTLLSTITGPMTLAPGVYCTGAALTGTGVLTLDAGGNPNAVWIFQIGGALTGTGFSVVMANGGQPCNVYWAPGAGVTMTTSTFSGNILAGGATGAITLTGGSLAGRALASGAVTMTGANVVGCSALPSSTASCNGKGDDDQNKDHKKCNQGVGNGPEGCDPGHSDQHNPFGSNDENGGTPGNPGRKGGNN